MTFSMMHKYEKVKLRLPGTRGLFACLSGTIVITTIVIDMVQASNRDIIMQALTDRLTRRSGEDLYELWHSDCHRSCRAQLTGHVNLACQFDPYKLTKRAISKRAINSTLSNILEDIETSPFLSKVRAVNFLQKGHRSQPSRHRVQKRGIMDECCYSKSCSWEEYAEYCHTYNRRPATRDTRCYP